jgi:hypothetical protein
MRSPCTLRDLPQRSCVLKYKPVQFPLCQAGIISGSAGAASACRRASMSLGGRFLQFVAIPWACMSRRLILTL